MFYRWLADQRTGFARITAESVYKKELGYGWRSSGGLREHNAHYSREWKYSESRGMVSLTRWNGPYVRYMLVRPNYSSFFSSR